MNSIKAAHLEKAPFSLPEWIDISDTFDFNNISNSLQANRKSKRNVRGKIWSKRLELFFGFIPALLVWVVIYGKKFR